MTTETQSTSNEPIPLNIQYGIKSLAKFIRRTERQTYHLVTTGQIPAKQIGVTWTWNPDRVREKLMEGM